MQQGTPIRRWTVEPVKAPAEVPAPLEEQPELELAPARREELVEA